MIKNEVMYKIMKDMVMYLTPYQLKKLKTTLQDKLEKNRNKDINLNWIKKFKNNKKVDVIDRNIITEFIDNIFIYEDGNAKIVFKNNNEYLEALKFLKTHNCVI